MRELPMNINIDRIEDLADEANAKGDNNLAVVLYTFLGARKVYMEKELAAHNQDWARKRSKEISQFLKKGDN